MHKSINLPQDRDIVEQEAVPGDLNPKPMKKAFSTVICRSNHKQNKSVTESEARDSELFGIISMTGIRTQTPKEINDNSETDPSINYDDPKISRAPINNNDHVNPLKRNECKILKKR